MRNAIRKNLNRKPLSVADRFFPSLAVAHHAGQLERFGNPAPVVFPLQLDGQIHLFMITSRLPRRASGPISANIRIE